MRFSYSSRAIVALTFAATLAGPMVSADPDEVVDDLQSPQDVQAHYDAANRSYVLSWQAPENASANTTYKVYRDGGLLGVSSGLTFTDADLPDLATWTYTITAQSDSVESVPATLVVVDFAILGPNPRLLGRESPIHYETPNIGSPHTCLLIVLGWGPTPPYLFGFDDDCLQDMIGP
jgi:hypothetical protein